MKAPSYSFISYFWLRRSYGDDNNQNLTEIVCLTQVPLSVHEYVFYGYYDHEPLTVYMLGSHKVNWNRADAVKGLVTSVVKGTGVSSLTADFSAATTKTVGGMTYYVSGSTVKLTLATSLSGSGVVFRANGVDLVKGNDGKYTLTLPDDATVVTVTATIPQSISGATVTLAQNSYTYDGTAKEPAVSSVTLGGTPLTAGTDYTVSYSDNILPGTATAIVTGKGAYCGTATAQFWVQPNDTQQAARRINIDFGDGETTNIKTTNYANDTNSDGAMYDLQGRKVTKPQKGLYIVNGKKVVIK